MKMIFSSRVEPIRERALRVELDRMEAEEEEEEGGGRREDGGGGEMRKEAVEKRKQEGKDVVKEI